MKIDSLSPRRRQVAMMTIRGFSDDDVSRLAGIARSTVHSTRCAIRKQLGITNDMQLLALAVQEAREKIAAEIESVYRPPSGAAQFLTPLDFIDELLP